MKIISVDDHIIEHSRVWQDRLPSKLRERGPRLVEVDGEEYWLFDGTFYPGFEGIATAVGLGYERVSRKGRHSSELPQGFMDPLARLADMDRDGVWAQVGFPTFPRFAGTRFLETKDRQLALACVQAYNDFILDEWCATARSRYVALNILPLWDVELAVKEFHRVVDKGAHSITFPEYFAPLGLPSIHSRAWDALFAAASEASIPFSIHFGTSGVLPQPSPDGPSATYIALMGTSSMATCVDYVFSHVFHEFPNVRLALSEGGIGWIPYLKERMDYTFVRNGIWSGLNQDRRPSEVFDQHVFGCFIDDNVGIMNRYLVGVTNIMIESDYPHVDSSFPHTRVRAKELLADVPDDEAHRIAELNARDLYGLV